VSIRSRPDRPADQLTAVQYGVGPIGSRIARAAVDRGVEFVGAIDIDPEKVGNDLGRTIDIGRSLDIPITDDPDAALAEEPEVVFHSTVSSAETAAPQLERAAEAGADVVSTCEELAYPWRAHKSIADELDAVATEYAASFLATGINPGFAMDTLTAVLTTPCQRVDSVRIERVQDAAERRGPLQEKIGAGCDLETFHEEVVSRGGHVGLPESTAMVAAALDWNLDSIETELEPVVADTPTESDHVRVDAGEVAGISQTATGFVNGEPRIVLDLSMYLGAKDPRDVVAIRGTQDVDVHVDGGLHGDVSTPAVVANTARPLRESDPGLLTMLDLPIVGCR
jgi:4-hydroxy-tetrahydrodipicolinate reductase